MRQGVMKAFAFKRLPSSSYEALSSYAAQTSASVELLLSAGHDLRTKEYGGQVKSNEVYTRNISAR